MNSARELRYQEFQFRSSPVRILGELVFRPSKPEQEFVVSKIPRRLVVAMSASSGDFRSRLIVAENRLISEEPTLATSPPKRFELMRGLLSLAYANVAAHMNTYLQSQIADGGRLNLERTKTDLLNEIGIKPPGRTKWTDQREIWIDQLARRGAIVAGNTNDPIRTYDDEHLLPWFHNLITSYIYALIDLRSGNEAYAASVGIFNEYSRRAAEAANAYLVSVSDTEPSNNANLLLRAKAAFLTLGLDWDHGLVAGIEGNIQSVAAMMLGVHRWAWDNGLSQARESNIVLSHLDLFSVPTNIKPGPLAKLEWPVNDFNWEALAKIVEDDPDDPDGFRWRGIEATSWDTPETFCSGMGNSTATMVQLADYFARDLVYPYGISENVVTARPDRNRGELGGPAEIFQHPMPMSAP
jgi:hypothetical protein